jgi:hypothetical protein
VHTDQEPYRQLHDSMLEYAGEAVYDELLRPWLARNDGERRWLDRLRARRGDPVPPLEPEESWRLYALSRIVELLQLSFAPAVADPDWTVPRVSREQYASFMDSLGLEAHRHDGFHPFFHEVVTVEQVAEETAPPSLVEECWPGYGLGGLLISRAGCRVRAGSAHLRKEIAERSTLYWAYARNHRPSEDLSRGWGGRSQWRTSFRRDYALDGRLHYNVDAAHRARLPDDGLDAVARAELLRHRCFVTYARPVDDPWPYDLHAVEDADEVTWGW